MFGIDASNSFVGPHSAIPPKKSSRKPKTRKVKVSFRWHERTPLSFSTQDRTLVMEVDGREYDTCFDVCSLLADAKATVVLEVEKERIPRGQGLWAKGPIKVLRQVVK